MKAFGEVLLSTVKIFDLPLPFDGITISFWDIFLWSIVALVFLSVLFGWWNGGK